MCATGTDRYRICRMVDDIRIDGMTSFFLVTKTATFIKSFKMAEQAILTYAIRYRIKGNISVKSKCRRAGSVELLPE